MASILPVLHQVAPRLTKRLFRCSRNIERRSTVLQNARSHTSPDLISRQARAGFRSGQPMSSQASSLLGSINAKNHAKAQPSFFPSISEKAVGYWLLGSAASVFGIVVFGGLTRLTESGLSITEWRPVTGSLLPASAGDWDSEFDKYRSSPEFKLLNPNMTLSEFKSIYYMEWTHRLWGRFVGLSFLLPAVYLVARRKVSRPMTMRILGIGGLIGFQGLLGWWMVQSGLKDDLFAPGSHPRVSQYRLVAHLGTAFLCYSAMLWNGLSILREHRLLGNLQAAQTNLARLGNPRLRIFRNSVGALAVMVFITAMSGGLVAGLDAGLIYNEFPKMGLGWAPPKSELFSDFYSRTLDGSDIWWRNLLENPSLVQLDHRLLATSTFSAVLALFAYSKFSPKIKKLLPVASRKAVHGVVGFACLQVVLGISTLIYMVPLSLASVHQAGSLALLSSVIILGNRTWLPSRRILILLAQKPLATAPKREVYHGIALQAK